MATSDPHGIRLDIWLDVSCLFRTRSEAQHACNAGDTIALITGSTQGLGQAAAKRFSEAGCLIINNGLVDGRVVGADLRQPAEIEKMIKAAGPIDILINNAVVRHTAPIEDFDPGAWNEALAVNLSAAFHTIRLALPGMKSRGWAASSMCRRSTASAAPRTAWVT